MKYPMPILRALPLRERPLHRVQRDVGACNLVELLAAVVGGPRQIEIAHDLLGRLRDLDGLAQASMEELALSYGLGPAGAARLKAALELGRRALLAAPEDRLVIRSPADVAQLLMAEMSHLEQEHFRVLFLDTRNRVLGAETLYVGSLNASHIRVGEVYREAVRRNCAAIICAHNHPSSDCSPSSEDVAVTRQIVEAGKLLDVECLDHLVIGKQRFVSLRERGLGF
jgi:DNA repair protein RadC